VVRRRSAAFLTDRGPTWGTARFPDRGLPDQAVPPGSQTGVSARSDEEEGAAIFLRFKPRTTKLASLGRLKVSSPMKPP